MKPMTPLAEAPRDQQPESQRGEQPNPILAVLQNRWTGGVLFFLFLPVGLTLIWLSPRWSKRAKWVWTAAAPVWFGLCAVGMLAEQSGLKRQHAQADQLWASGDHAKAVAKYEDLLTNERHWLHTNIDVIGKEHGPTVYGRVIDHHASGGDVDKARKFVGLARRRAVAPACETKAGRAALQE